VNAAWAGLGFYGRARRLHEGAQYVMQKYGGVLPHSCEELRNVPGVGPYTAGAIASIAFNQRAAVVDGNVVRVFSRLAALEGHAKSAALHKRCWMLAEQVVDPDQPGAFNQALMELGATVCTPSAPSCARCPLRWSCKAYKLADSSGPVTRFPAKPVLREKRHKFFALLAISDAAESWMLVRRPQKGLLAGQLEFPSAEIEVPNNGSIKEGRCQALEKAPSHVRRILAELGLPAELPLTSFDPLEHIFSHEHHMMFVFMARISIIPTRLSGGDVLWLSPNEAEKAGITSGLRKVWHVLVPSVPLKRRKT